jgi:hypothetical protein
MSEINSSPERHTFQKEGYIKRCEEEGKEPNPDYIDMYKTWREQDAENLVNPEWQKDNMEYDLRSTKWICDKAKGDEVYAQNLYAAMCNRDFTKNDVWPILTEKKWGCSWRYAGGIIADMREEGDYIDWYCSGIKNNPSEEEIAEFNDVQKQQYLQLQAFVSEGFVTDEIREDLLKLGWVVLPDDFLDD